MSDPRPQRRDGRRRCPPTMLTLLAALPDDEWVSVDQAAARAEGVGLAVGHQGDQLVIGDRPLRSLLRGLRREGWVLYEHRDGGRWMVVPSGREAARRAIPRLV